ncbi:rhodanese-like domain-containing protein [bacterium]|nr:rhodanese-like domain-containing protein [bacterium]
MRRISLFREIVFVSLLSILVGFGGKAVRQSNVPFWGRPIPVKLISLPDANAGPLATHPDSLFVPADAPYHISLARAAGLFLQQEKLGVYFVDARSHELYTEGHIPGALNLPSENFDEDCDAMVQLLDKGRLIVIYCDNKECPLSLELAEILLGMEFRRIAVFEEGWDKWVESGYPTATGTEETEESD